MVPWELLVAVGGMLMNVFVIPTLLNSDAGVSRAQSVPMSIILLCFLSIPYFQIGLLWPSVATGIGSILWALVAIFRPVD